MDKAEQRLLTVDQLCEKFGVSEVLIWKSVKQGMPSIRQTPKSNRDPRVLFPEADCAVWIAANASQIVKTRVSRNLKASDCVAAIKATEATSRKLEAVPQIVEAMKTPESKASALLPKSEKDKVRFKYLQQVATEHGLKWSLERAKHAEIQAFQMLLDAYNQKDINLIQARLRIYNEAAKALKEFENAYDARDEQYKEILEEFVDTLKQWFEPVCALVDAAPKSLAVRCNPENPGHAQKAIESWVDGSLKPMMSRGFRNRNWRTIKHANNKR
jgi:predicted DNA-binding transcriptional regulator AlpA